MQNCPCLYFNEGNENFLLLLPFTSCASWNERGDPTAPEFNVPKDNCHQAAWVWRCPLCSYTQLTFPAESGFSIHVLGREVICSPWRDFSPSPTTLILICHYPHYEIYKNHSISADFQVLSQLSTWRAGSLSCWGGFLSREWMLNAFQFHCMSWRGRHWDQGWYCWHYITISGFSQDIPLPLQMFSLSAIPGIH